MADVVPRRLHLVRHAPTEANRAVVYAGRSDDGVAADAAPLIRQTAQYLAEACVRQVVSSPQRRAVATAEPLAESLRLDVEIVDAVAEMDMGPWTGRTSGEIAVRYPDLWNKWRVDPVAVSFEGFEGLSAVERRAAAWLGWLANGLGEEDVACFTHETVIKMIIGSILGAASQSYRALIVPNCGVSTLVLDSGCWRIQSVNGFVPVAD